MRAHVNGHSPARSPADRGTLRMPGVGRTALTAAIDGLVAELRPWRRELLQDIQRAHDRQLYAL